MVVSTDCSIIIPGRYLPAGIYPADYTRSIVEYHSHRLCYIWFAGPFKPNPNPKMAVIATVFKAAGLAVSEKKTETMLLRTSDQIALAPPLVIEAAGQRYKQTAQFLYLSGIIHGNADL